MCSCIRSVREDHLVVYYNGKVMTKINDQYNNLKYGKYEGNRIFYKFDDEAEVQETYDDSIFNCTYKGETMQVRKSEDISRAIKLNSINDNFIKVPILSSIAAGEPLIVNPEQIVAGEDYDDYVELPNNFSKEKNLFALRVKGDSMIDALISNNDIVIMKSSDEANNGEMVAAWLPQNEEVTLKRFYFRNNKVELHSENPKYDPIILDPKNVLIKGKVVGVIRKV